MTIPWNQITQREQLVWAITYARQDGDPANLARLADVAVSRLQQLRLDAAGQAGGGGGGSSGGGGGGSSRPLA